MYNSCKRSIQMKLLTTELQSKIDILLWYYDKWTKAQFQKKSTLMYNIEHQSRDVKHVDWQNVHCKKLQAAPYFSFFTSVQAKTIEHKSKALPLKIVIGRLKK